MKRSVGWLWAAALLTACDGCAGLLGEGVTPRQRARAAVLVLAEGVSAADEICAATALGRHDLALAERCEDAYQLARASLWSAAEGVDAWGTTADDRTACATLRGAAAAHELAEALRSAGAAVPPVLSDGLALFAALGPVACNLHDGGAS